MRQYKLEIEKEEMDKQKRREKATNLEKDGNC